MKYVVYLFAPMLASCLSITGAYAQQTSFYDTYGMRFELLEDPCCAFDFILIGDVRSGSLADIAGFAVGTVMWSRDNTNGRSFDERVRQPNGIAYVEEQFVRQLDATGFFFGQLLSAADLSTMMSVRGGAENVEPSGFILPRAPVELYLGFHLDESARVIEVFPDTPAARAGIQAGDIVMGLPGWIDISRPTEQVLGAVMLRMRRAVAGGYASIELRVRRNGQDYLIDVPAALEPDALLP